MKLVLTVTVLLLTACTAASKKASPVSYFNGHPAPTVTSAVIKNELTRGENNFPHYAVEVYPITKTYLEVRDREDAKRAMDSDVVSKDLSKHVTCFSFVVSTNSIDVSMFKYFRSKVDLGEGGMHEVKFTSSDIPSPVGKFSYTWTNWTTGCVGKELDLSKGFKLLFLSTVYKDSTPTLLTWEPAKS